MQFSKTRPLIDVSLDSYGRTDFEATPRNLVVRDYPVSAAMDYPNISVTVFAYKRRLSVTGDIIELHAFYEGQTATSIVRYYSDDIEFWTEVARVVGAVLSNWEQANAVESDKVSEHTDQR